MIEGQASGTKTPRLRYGMVGGGQGAFIGDVHRKAVAMDGKAEIVCGAFYFQSHHLDYGRCVCGEHGCMLRS